VGIALGALGAAERDESAISNARVHDKMVMVSRVFRDVAKPVLDRGGDGSSADSDPGIFAAAAPAGDGVRVAYGTSDSADETDIGGGATGDGGPLNQCRTRMDAHLVPMK
jgi:hypothetical protein